MGPNTFATVTSQRRNSTKNRCFTIHSSFPSVTRTERRDAKRGSLAVLVENVSGSRPGSAKRTLPALNRNQLADRLLQINLICELSQCHENQSFESRRRAAV